MILLFMITGFAKPASPKLCTVISKSWPSLGYFLCLLVGFAGLIFADLPRYFFECPRFCLALKPVSTDSGSTTLTVGDTDVLSSRF